jgi:TP901 family phage tail tape measure protein
VAGSRFNITAFLGLNSDDMNKGLGKGEANLASFKSVGIAALAGFAVAAAAAMVAAAASVVKFTVSAIQEFAAFEQKFLEVMTLLPGISQREMGKMKTQILDLTATFGFATDDAVPALYQAISAGVPQANVFDFMQVASKAAIGGVTSLETAVDGITTVINTYGRENINAQQAADYMFTTVKLGKTTFDELSRSLYNVLPLANAAGVGMDAVSASMAVLTAQGVPTAVATTQLRAAIQAIMSPSGRTKKALNLMGVEVEDLKTLIQKKPDGLVQAMIKIEQAANGDKEKLRLMLGSVEAINAVLAIAKNKAAAFYTALFEMENSAGAADTAFETMSKGMEFTWNKIKANAKAAMIKFGDAMSPLITSIIPLFNYFGNILAKLPFAQLGMWVKKTSDTFATKLNPVLLKIKWALADLWDALQPVIWAIGALFVNKVGDAQRATLGLANIIPLLIKFLELLVTAFTPVIMALTGAIQKETEMEKATNTNASVFGILVKVLGLLAKVLTEVIQWMIDIINYFQSCQSEVYSFNYLLLHIKSTFLNLFNKVLSAFTKFNTVLIDGWKEIGDVVMVLIADIWDAFKALWPSLAGKLSGFINKWEWAWQGAFDFIKGKFKWLIDIYNQFADDQIQIAADTNTKIKNIDDRHVKQKDAFMEGFRKKREAREKAHHDRIKSREEAATQKLAFENKKKERILKLTLQKMGLTTQQIHDMTMTEMKEQVAEYKDKGKQAFVEVARNYNQTAGFMRKTLAGLGIESEEKLGKMPDEAVNEMFHNAGARAHKYYRKLEQEHYQEIAQQQQLDGTKKQYSAEEKKRFAQYRNMSWTEIQKAEKDRLQLIKDRERAVKKGHTDQLSALKQYQAEYVKSKQKELAALLKTQSNRKNADKLQLARLKQLSKWLKIAKTDQDKIKLIQLHGTKAGIKYYGQPGTGVNRYPGMTGVLSYPGTTRSTQGQGMPASTSQKPVPVNITTGGGTDFSKMIKNQATQISQNKWMLTHLRSIDKTLKGKFTNQ